MALARLSKLLETARAGGYAIGYFEAWDTYSLEAVADIYGPRYTKAEDATLDRIANKLTTMTPIHAAARAKSKETEADIDKVITKSANVCVCSQILVLSSYPPCLPKPNY